VSDDAREVVALGRERVDRDDSSVFWRFEVAELALPTRA